jgi:hypothetical protein
MQFEGSIMSQRHKLLLIAAFPLFAYLLLRVFAGAPVESQDGVPDLVTSYDSELTQRYESESRGIAFNYPSEWAIYDSVAGVRLVEKESYFNRPPVWALRPDFYVHTGPPHANTFRRGIAMSAADLAKTLDYKGSFDPLQPISSVSINGHDGAIQLERDNNVIYYAVYVRVSEDKMATVSVHGPADEMQEIVDVTNVIALSIEPFDE